VPAQDFPPASTIIRPGDDAALHAFATHLRMDDEKGLRLLRQALTHRSLAGIAPQGDNERLEFLGDSVLGMLVNEHLYRSFPEEPEGVLTKMKARLVSEPALADAARRLGLGPMLTLSASEEATGGRERPSTLSDAFEAVVAAVYLHRGLPSARRLVREALIRHVDVRQTWDHKSRLQELLQERYRVTPTYRILEETGPAHDRRFVAEVRLHDRVLGRGVGRSKKAAEQAAAAAALAQPEFARAGARSSDASRSE